MNKEGHMKPISEIQKKIEEKYSYIPLLQRNYKWSRECAAELAEDLWDAFRDGKDGYQLNMITIFSDEKNHSLQILDGQQRMITLKLLLAILDSANLYLNYDFERDYEIDERCGRRYFLNHVLKDEFHVQDVTNLSVDTLRLWGNYKAMILPISFRTVFSFYSDCLEKENRGEEKAEVRFKKYFNDIVVGGCVQRCLGDRYKQSNIEKYKLNEEELKDIHMFCVEVQKIFSKEEDDDEISDDEIRMSEWSDKFQDLWVRKLDDYISVIEKYDNASGLASYILERVEMLYHETTSEPIDEFLNINENKTRFVISDYIRANMISDNPVDGDGLTDEQKQKNQKNRDKVLEVFASLSDYLYSGEYEVMWNLVKTRYDDFEKNPDINRLKIVFCDKYLGTSIKGYVFEEELARLEYFNDILTSLKTELGLGTDSTDLFWNTYNAVYILLECKKTYRFFHLFTKEDIKEHTSLNDVTVREKFCFFEDAYEKAKKSDDVWDISYFLESQLYEKECKVKKEENLPEETDSEWCLINRGEKGDDLQKCLEQLIEKIKTGEIRTCQM